MILKWYMVGDITGGYSDEFGWFEAEETAIRESKKGALRLILESDTRRIVAIFYDGERWIKATGQSCEVCGTMLDDDNAHYSHYLTGHYFCSQKCGLELRVLRDI